MRSACEQSRKGKGEQQSCAPGLDQEADRKERRAQAEEVSKVQALASGARTPAEGGSLSVR